MLKIQYAIAGFFAGAFAGLLVSLVEMRFIHSNHSAALFIVNSITILFLGIVGARIAIGMAKKKLRSKE